MSIRNPFESNLFKTRSLVTSNPAAGDQASIPVHAYARSELLNLSFRFTADGNAADRLVTVSLKRGAELHRLGFPLTLHTASKRYIYICNSAPPNLLLTGVDYFHIHLPSIPVLAPGDTIEIDVDNIQVADQIDLISTLWKYWIFDTR